MLKSEYDFPKAIHTFNSGIENRIGKTYNLPWINTRILKQLHWKKLMYAM